MAVKLNQADLQFILDQIKLSEAHTAGADLTDLIPDPHVPWGLRTVDGSYNSIIPGREMWGSADQAMPRLLDASWNDDQDGDQMPFGPPGSPVVTNTNYQTNGNPTGPNNNGGHPGNVADADPRIISNLIVDMSLSNPAAISAWQNNALAQAAWFEEHGEDAIQLFPGDTMVPNGVFVTNDDLANIPNIAPDEGLSAPFNTWMTFFGQFFDHGLDLVTKGGNGTVYIPLQPDDPLITHGPDGIAGNGDEVTPNLAFMTLTRASTVREPGADGVLNTADDVIRNESVNTTTPFVDQNQTYTSHASHQVFLREYAVSAAGRPVSTGGLLDGKDPAGNHNGLPTWGEVKEQARMLGIELTDGDVLNIPLIRTDAYGKFIPFEGAAGDPRNGFAQVITGIGADGIPNTADDIVAVGTPAAPVNTFAVGALRTGHAFLDDIAHTAAPFGDHDGVQATPRQMLQADDDDALGLSNSTGNLGRYDDELLDKHFITGDGRGNENVGLSAVHHVFHSEHNRLAEQNKRVILETGDVDFVNEWLIDDLTQAELDAILAGNPTQLELRAAAEDLVWDGERIFQAARFGTEMQYQHLVFEEFARKIQPNVDPFVFNSITDVDPSIFAEFANTVYRFGHSMLTETIARTNADGSDNSVDLITAFLNPVEFFNGGSAGTLTADEAAGAFVRGMTQTQGNEIDEFVTGALRNNLLGLPLDLAAINIARGRDTGMPTLNEARQQLFEASGSTFLKPYEHWVDFAANLKNPASVINFIAAYGTHSSITDRVVSPTSPGGTREKTLEEKRDAATLLVMGNTDLNGNGVIDVPNEVAPADRVQFLTGTGAWAPQIVDGENVNETGLNLIDLWIGGLAEKKMEFGGMLGSTFNAIFELQMENLQDGDRFYYLTRVQGQNFLNELEQNSFSKLIMANTDISQPGADGIRGTSDDIVNRHIGVDSFANYDYVFEIDKTHQSVEDPISHNPVLEALGLKKVMRDNLSTLDIDESQTAGSSSITALLKQYDASGAATGATIDGSEDGVGAAGSPATWADLKANAERLGITLTDEDVLNAPVLRVDAGGNPLFQIQPVDPFPVTVADGSFETTSLADGAPNVTSDVRGNYTFTPPPGWTITGTGGLYAPVDTISDTDGHVGPNVAWLAGGSTLAQDTGHTLVAGVNYQMSLNVGDRTDFPWPGGVVRLVATNGATSVVVATQVLPEPVDGQWAPFNLSTGPIAPALAGYDLRIEVANTGSGPQMLVDNVTVATVPPVVYSSDDNVADIVGYNPAFDPFIRDASGNVVRSGQPIIPNLPANATPGNPAFDPAVLAALLVDVDGLLEVAELVGHYFRFVGGEHIVVGGTSGNDTIVTDFGDDGIWGDAGDDRIESGAGVDLVNGGGGDDIITDSGDSFDFLKGEDGDDVIANSNGIDIVMGGRDDDVVFVGVDFTEVFAGDGNDFVAGGDDMDLLMGNEGDDWIEGGGGFDTVAGDNSELFFNSKILGHDVLFAGNDENDFDAESGDDIMVQGESVMRNEGMFGFDWVSFQGMQLDAYADMRIRIFTTEQEDILRNRFDKVEALSGWDRNDTLIGDERTAADALDDLDEVEIGEGNENIFFNDGLSQAGVDRIDGLRDFLGSLIDDAPAGATAEELEALIAFDQGNILLGGRGNDRLQGNGGDDVLDGDRYLNVRISITAPNDPSEEIATVTTLRHTFTAADGVDASWVGRSLFDLLLDRTVRPADMHIVREILNDTANGGFDTAIFRGSIAEYSIEGAGLANAGNLAYWDVDGDGFITVTHSDPQDVDGVEIADGQDFLTNVERLEFTDATLNQVAGSNAAPTGSISISDPSPSIGSILSVVTTNLADPDSVTATNPTGAIDADDLEIVWEVEDALGSGVFILAGTGPTLTVTAAMLGLEIRAIARFRDGDGVVEAVISEPTRMVANNVTPTGTSGADVLIGRNAADTIDGLAGDDEIYGMGGADRIIGGTGSDIIDGGGGSDTVVFAGNVGQYTFEFDELGNMEVVHTASGDEDLVTNVEFLEFGNQTLTLEEAQNQAGIIGTNQPETLFGTVQDDFMSGLGGADTLNGFAGDDILFGDGGGDVLNGDGGADILNGGNGSDTLNGGAGADTLNGDANDDTLNGDNGADILTGGVGDDIVNGGDGNDTIVWNAGDGRDRIIGGANGGPGDTFQINGDLQTENFIIYSRPDAIAAGITGLAAATQIVVTRNGDVIGELTGIEEIVVNANGGGGTVQIIGDFDPSNLAQNTITINGSTGADTVDISNLTSSHRILFNTGGGHDVVVGDLRSQDVINLASSTSAAAYVATQSGGTTTVGDGENEVSFASGGTPTFSGAPVTLGEGMGDDEDDDDDDDDDTDEDDNGDDDSDEDDSDDDEDEDDDHDHDDDSDGSGCDDDDDEEDDDDGSVVPTPPASGGGTAIAGIIAGTVAGEILIGTASAETILGLEGSDNLFGQAGDDTIRSGDGEDFAAGGDGRDVILGNGGDDEIFGGTGGDSLFGDAGGDLIYGDAGDDLIEGGTGADTVFGGEGNDLILALLDDGADTYWGENGIDTLDYAAITQNLTVDLGNGLMERGSVKIAGGASDTIYGFENFVGGEGDDLIVASSSVNVMDGGDGDDVFRFDSAGQADGDMILNFRPGDKIDVSRIDAKASQTGNQDFTLVSGTSFSAAGQVTVEHQTRADGEYTVVRGNLDADGVAEFEIGLKGRIDLTADDFTGLN